MPGEHAETGVDLGAERLGDAQDDAAEEGSPERPDPPITTASKAKISRCGPDPGSKEE